MAAQNHNAANRRAYAQTAANRLTRGAMRKMRQIIWPVGLCAKCGKSADPWGYLQTAANRLTRGAVRKMRQIVWPVGPCAKIMRHRLFFKNWFQGPLIRRACASAILIFIFVQARTCSCALPRCSRLQTGSQQGDAR